MKNSIKIWFVGSSAAIKEFSVPKKAIGFFLALLLVFAAALMVKAHDYFKLKDRVRNTAVLSETIASQTHEIENQRLQIQAFVKEINQLKGNLLQLSDFEQKVRVIADMNQTSETTGFFGIGGIGRADLDTDLPLDRKHNHLIREMHQQINQIDLGTQEKSSDFEQLLGFLENKKNLLESTPSIRPVKGGWISSKFGYRKSPFTGKREFHSGLDIANRTGTKIYATAAGRVSYTGKKMLLGEVVIIDHGHGVVTRYGHMKKSLVKRGAKVKRGDVIGLMGNSGRSTGPHVHYEVKVNGLSVNPKKYILN